MNSIFRFGRFLAGGIPGAGFALALNYYLTGLYEWPAALAYPIVLLAQSLLNYCICRHFVFGEEGKQHPFWPHFFRFLSGTLVFRGLDWILYISQVALGVPILLAQSLNIILFSLFRFRFVSSLFGNTHRS